MTEPTITPLTPDEQQWVTARRDFAAQEGVDHLDLDAVDAYSSRLVARSRAEDVDPEELEVLLEVAAVLLGEHLGARHGLQWVTVTDDAGTDLGLRDHLSDAVVFPLSEVGTRWNAGETGWMPGYVDELGARLQELRTAMPTEG